MRNKFGIIFCFVFFLASAFSARADVVGISVDQTVFAFSTAPSSKKTVSLRVKNTSNSVQNIAINFQDFVVGDNNAIAEITDKNEQFGMKEWLSTEKNSWFLEPQQTRQIDIDLAVPDNATVGAHWAVANIQALPQIDGQNFQQTIVGGQVGAYVMVNVSGAVSGSGNLKKFSAPIIAQKDVQLKADFENTGNILYIPHGEVHMQNILTRQKSDFETEKHFVFPGKNFSFNIDWKPESIFGIYKAQALFVDGNGVTTSSQRIILGKLFFVWPLTFFLLLLFFVKKRTKFSRNK